MENWIAGIFGIVGVVVGALITPLTIAYLEKKKIKRELKSNLVKQIHIFFNIRKSEIYISNAANLFNKRVELICDQLAEKSYSEIELAVWNKEYDRFSNLATDRTNKYNEYIIRGNDIEADIESLMINVQTYYRRKCYDELYPVITNALNEANETVDVTKFEHFTLDNINEAGKILHSDSVNENKKLNAKSNLLKSTIGRILG